MHAGTFLQFPRHLYARPIEVGDQHQRALGPCPVAQDLLPVRTGLIEACMLLNRVRGLLFLVFSQSANL